MTEWLVEDKDRVPTEMSYHAGYKPSRIRSVEFVVYHYTAVNAATSIDVLTKLGDLLCHECNGEGKLETNRNCRMCRGEGHFENSPRSAHFVVEENGRIVQLAPLSSRTWHAGGSTSRWMDGGNVNGRSIGVEVVNYGPLDKHIDGHLYDWVGHKVLAPTKVSEHGGRWWMEYPEPQMAAVEILTQELIGRHPVLTEGPDRLTGHQHVDPTRKLDPGPVFEWQRIRKHQTSG